MNGDQYPPSGDQSASSSDEEPSDQPSGAGGHKGFVPPSARPWIHPSELSVGQIKSAPRPYHRRPSVVLGTAAAVIVVTGFAAFSLRNTTTPPTTAVNTAPSVSDIPAGLRMPAESLVSITFHQGSTTEQADGVILNSQDVITTATIPTSIPIDVTLASGKNVHASVMKRDGLSNVTVLHLEAAVPHAVTQTTSATHSAVQVLSFATSAQGSTMKWAPASNLHMQQTVSHNSMPFEVMTATSALPAEAGNLLIDSSGTVVGVGAPDLGATAYLPMSFVAAVGTTLSTSPVTGHGYLRIEGTDAAGGGAKITTVSPTSPGVQLLNNGDVIVRVDGKSITSIAGLVDALYVIPAGSTIHLTVLRNGATQSVAVSLAASP